MARRLPASRPLAPALTLTAALALTGCAVTLNPGPGDPEIGAASAQIGEPSEPVVVADGPSGRGAEAEIGPIEVRPAPSSRDGERGGSSDDGGPGSSGGDGSTGNGDGADGAPPGTPDAGDPGAGDAESGDTGPDDTGSEPVDLADPVQYAQVLEDEVNLRREQHGLAPLDHDECAYAEALERAEDLRGRDLAHAALDPIFDRCPTSTVGENLARGGWTPAEAADGWMDSEGHRANILNEGFTRGAIACISEDTEYGAQMTCAHVFLG